MIAIRDSLNIVTAIDDILSEEIEELRTKINKIERSERIRKANAWRKYNRKNKR